METKIQNLTLRAYNNEYPLTRGFVTLSPNTEKNPSNHELVGILVHLSTQAIKEDPDSNLYDYDEIHLEFRYTVNPEDNNDQEILHLLAKEYIDTLLMEKLRTLGERCTGDDDYYDYIPDYVDTLIQFNEQTGAYPAETLQEAINNLNYALHAEGHGWELPEE